MLRTEVTVGGCSWAVEPIIRRSLFNGANYKILCFCGQRSHPQVFYWPLAAAAAPPTMLARSRRLAASFFTQLAGGDTDVRVWRLPACGRAQCESRPVGLQAYRLASHIRWRCAAGRSYSGPHTVGSGVLHLRAKAAFPVEYIRFSVICASVQSCRSTVDSKERFGRASCPKCE